MSTAEIPERRRRSAYSEGRTVRILNAQTKGKKGGPWATYHENGQLSYKGTYKEGKYDGPWVEYRSDGTFVLNLARTFKNGVKVE